MSSGDENDEKLKFPVVALSDVMVVVVEEESFALMFRTPLTRPVMAETTPRSTELGSNAKRAPI